MSRSIGERSNMKTSIPSDVWETKRSQIAMLYKEEEWPLKQVIKRIRSDDFNPTETQLRSRLKKWGVTKPSRQRRKKSISSTSNGLVSNSMDLGAGTTADRQCLPHLGVHGLRPSAYHDHTSWANSRACLIAPSPHQLALLKGSPFDDGHPSGASWPPLPTLSHSGTQPMHLLQQLSNVSPLSPTLHCGPAGNCSTAIEPASTGHQSPSTKADRTLADEVSPHQNYLVADVGQPPSPWECPPETCQPCETTLYAPDGAVSPYERYPKLEHSDDSVHSFPGSESASPRSDIEFLETDPTMKSWTDPSSITFSPGLHTGHDQTQLHAAIVATNADKPKEGFASAKVHLARIRTHFETDVQSSHISCTASAAPENISPLDPPTSPINSAASEYAIQKLICDSVRVRC